MTSILLNKFLVEQNFKMANDVDEPLNLLIYCSL